MPPGFPSTRCKAKSKRTGERCRRSCSPFQEVCIAHGANAPTSRAKAEEAFQRYLNMPPVWEPDWLRAVKIRAYLRSVERYEARRMKKAGITPEDLARTERLAPSKNPPRAKSQTAPTAELLAPIPYEEFDFDWEV